jgi:hypothetical protein
VIWRRADRALSPSLAIAALALVVGIAIDEPTAAAATNFSVVNNAMSSWLVNGQSNPTLTLVKGQTYTFTIDPAAFGHPFWITTARGAEDAPTNAWSPGVTNNGAAAGTVLSFTVSAASAPATLFYQCSFHEPMGGQLNIVAPATTSVPALGPLLVAALAALLLAVAIVTLRRRRFQSTIAAIRDRDQ